jgi:hypothetical protein
MWLPRPLKMGCALRSSRSGLMLVGFASTAGSLSGSKRYTSFMVCNYHASKENRKMPGRRLSP